MKNNYGLGAYVIEKGTTKQPSKVSVIHLCMYEKPPTDKDVDALIEELATDEEFGMTNMVFNVDYGIMELNDETFAKMKADLGIPDDTGD